MLFASKVNNDTADIKTFPRSWRAVDNSKPSAPIYGQIREDSEASLLFTELKWHEISTLAFCILTDAHALLWIVIRVWRQSYPVFLPSRIWLPHYTSGVNPPQNQHVQGRKLDTVLHWEPSAVMTVNKLIF